MAVKIKLTRLGKIRNPQYRVVIADSRTRRNGRAIESIGKYHPKEEPSLIRIDSERAQYWLGVGAQPSDQVRNLLVLTGDIAKFNGKADAVSRVVVSEADKAAQAEQEIQPLQRRMPEVAEVQPLQATQGRGTGAHRARRRRSHDADARSCHPTHRIRRGCRAHPLHTA